MRYAHFDAFVVAACGLLVLGGCGAPPKRSPPPATHPASAPAAKDAMADDQSEQMAAEDADSFRPKPPEPEERSTRPPDVRNRRAIDQPRVRPR